MAARFLRCGVIGLGRTGRAAVAYLQSRSDCLVASVTDDPAVDILGDNLNLVVVASWDQFHAEQVCRALDRGMAVWCEKPLCLSMDELGELERRPGWLGMNLVLRIRVPRPAFQPYRIDASYNWGRREKMKGWRGSIDYSPVLGGGIHLIDLIERDLGPVKEARSVSMGHTVVTALKCEHGVASLTSDLASPPPHRHGYHCWGTAEDWAWDGVAAAPDGTLLRSFVDSVIYGGDALVTRAETIGVMRSCFLVEQSWRSARP